MNQAFDLQNHVCADVRQLPGIAVRTHMPFAHPVLFALSARPVRTVHGREFGKSSSKDEMLRGASFCIDHLCATCAISDGAGHVPEHLRPPMFASIAPDHEDGRMRIPRQTER
ncbi:hypothetical protein [Paraburkholderia tagetis]|uniref:Uncharacterized protein n=1 Tax=Paraburkholderia tagetis TaxID=2913261 RepID=A0A9X1RSS8_9BURK|nr:hypothetical protein [Paraburkholderia tagetis]MCG5076695.1 hypothetical protein [Paraburkholderia tagetis]